VEMLILFDSREEEEAFAGLISAVFRTVHRTHLLGCPEKINPREYL